MLKVIIRCQIEGFCGTSTRIYILHPAPPLVGVQHGIVRAPNPAENTVSIISIGKKIGQWTLNSGQQLVYLPG